MSKPAPATAGKVAAIAARYERPLFSPGHTEIVERLPANFGKLVGEYVGQLEEDVQTCLKLLRESKP